MVAVGHLNAFQYGCSLTAPLRLRNAESEWFARSFWTIDFFHALDLFELALRLSGFRGDGPKAVGEFLEGVDFLLLVFPRRILDIEIALPLDHGLRVVALVMNELLGRNFVDVIDESIHELTIMGDEQKGT